MTTSGHTDHPLVTSGRVRGAEVISADGHKLGKIEELALDKASGAVAYAILGEGGLLGMGEHYRPLAWRDLVYDAERHAFTVPLTKADVQAIAELPGDDLSGWTVSKSVSFI